MGGPAVKKFLSKYSVELLCILLALAMILSVSVFAGYSKDAYKDSAAINEAD